MRRFYLAFPIQDAVRPELSWTHYRQIMKVSDSNARMFYVDEAAKAGWSTRQLERQINTQYYNRILASRDKESVAAEIQTTVPIDLKTDDLTHQDIGQMQMYVNYYTRNMMNEGDNPPIGILLCADKSDTLVKYTLPEENSQIYASKYLSYMPTEEELKRELKVNDFQKLD